MNRYRSAIAWKSNIIKGRKNWMLSKNRVESVSDNFCIDFLKMFDKADQPCQVQIAVKGVTLRNWINSTMFSLLRNLIRSKTLVK